MSVFDAVAEGDVKKIKKLLKSGDANELGPGGTTPLIEAARAGSTDVVELLLELGAEPAWKDEEGETALLKAAANGHRGVIELLLPHADRDERDLAEAFLAANRDPNKSPTGPGFQPTGLMQRAARATAAVAGALGHDEPLERLQRAEDAKKKR